METKQVLVVRKDLNMRKGKMCAQAAHASLAVILNRMTEGRWVNNISRILKTKEEDPLNHWLEHSFTKICVSVDSEEELIEIYNLALKAGLPCSLIKDNGKTEFKEPTYTVVAVGPGEVSEIDKITGKLKLL